MVETRLATDAESGIIRSAEPATNVDDGVLGVSGSTIVVNHMDVSLTPDAEYVNTQGVRFTAHSGAASEGLSSCLCY